MSSEKIELSKDKVNLIVAYTSKQRYIGYNKDLPWKRSLNGDMKFFMNLSRLHSNIALVVGRRTYETIRRISDLTMLVVTSSEIEGTDRQKAFKSLKEAIEYARKKDMYVLIGGGVEIYREALEKYDYKAFCTVVDEDDLKGDRSFPEVSMDLKNITSDVEKFLLEKNVKKTWEHKDNSFNENGYKYSFYLGSKK